MTGLETVAFATLWIALAAVAMLVLILYRQLDKLYSSEFSRPGLANGVVAPAIDIIGSGEEAEVFTPNAADDTLIVFATTECDACRDLVQRLAASGDELPVATQVLVVGEGFTELHGREWTRLKLDWLWNPGDMTRTYRVNAVPTLYLVRQGRIAGTTTDASVEGLERLLSTPESDLQTQRESPIEVRAGGG